MAEKPPPLLDGYKHNFELLKKAFRQKDVALVSAIRKSDQQPVALVCAIQVNEDQSIAFVPLAVMCEGNPFDDFEDPTIV